MESLIFGEKRPNSYYINKFNFIHNNKYDYSLFDNSGCSHTKNKIICPIHGEFFQSIADHLHKKREECILINNI